MFPIPQTTEDKPLLNWVVAPEIYPKGTLHPSNAPERLNRLTWRILLQTIATHLREYEREHDTKEKEQWQTRIFRTINEANELNKDRLWGMEEMPLSPDCLAPTVNGMSWLECMIQKLNSTFGCVQPVFILKID